MNEAASVLDPAGPVAQQIAQLSWVLFAGAALIFAVVLLASLVAIRGSDRARRLLASESLVTVAGVILPVVILSALLGYGLWLMGEGRRPTDRSSAMRIEVVGEQWWWRVSYATVAGGAIASANEIRIPVNRPIEFVLRSADVIHSFWVPSLGGKIDMIPGRTTQLRLQASRAGVFKGQCAEYCGGPHALMAFEVVALAADEFEAWLSRQAEAAREPATPMAERGKALFLAAGCAGCHAVRGTAAAGTVGPDLTHLASRRSLGGNLLPLSRVNLARFIADGQHIKPANKMPPFRIFSEDELLALSTYLLDLQ